MRARFVLLPVGASLLACGGVGGAAATTESKYGSVEFQTYMEEGTWLKFNPNGKVAYGWRNAACDELKGTWTQEGEEIVVHLDDPENCNGWDDMKIRQMSDCAMAAYWFKDPTTGETKDDDSWTFERTEPKCPR